MNRLARCQIGQTQSCRGGLTGVTKVENFTKKVLVKNLAGCGVQFNQHVFAAITGSRKSGSTIWRRRSSRSRRSSCGSSTTTSSRATRWIPPGSGGSGEEVELVRACCQARAARGCDDQRHLAVGEAGHPSDRDRSMTRFANVLETLVRTGQRHQLALGDDPERAEHRGTEGQGQRGDARAARRVIPEARPAAHEERSPEAGPASWAVT